MPTFVSEWKTDNPGLSEDNQISLPLVSGGTYDFTVDWGDGSQDTITAHNDAAVTHTYATAGTYTVEITGTIVGFNFNQSASADNEKLLDISQWGPLVFDNNAGHYTNCVNLDISATDAPVLGNTLRESFQNTGLTEPNLNAWDTSPVSSFRGVFHNCSSFNGFIENWDLSNGTRTDDMFRSTPFNRDIGGWNMSNISDASSMFNGNSVFNQDISGWDMSSLSNGREMFRNASSFNQDISNWNTSSLGSARMMFMEALSFNQDLSKWDISNVGEISDMLRDTAISDENYSRMLIAWSQLPLSSDRTFDNTPAQYFSGAAAEARAKIAADFGWTIADDGEDTTSTSYAVIGQTLDGLDVLVNEAVVWTSEQADQLDAVTSAEWGEQVGRFAVMTTDALTFPNESDVNGSAVTIEETTFIYEQDVSTSTEEITGSTTAPYTGLWTPSEPGIYRVVASFTTEEGSTLQSDPVDFEVEAST